MVGATVLNAGSVRQLANVSVRNCPFISGLSPLYLKNYGASILKMYGDKCPFMRHYSSTFNPESLGTSALVEQQPKNVPNPQAAEETKKKIPLSKCPFMEHVKPTVKAVSSELDDENIDLGKNEKFSDHFKYEDVFLDKIAKKKENHSYRIFRKVNRPDNNFPSANDFVDSEKKLAIWCSNEYLGISSHSKVKQAVIDAVELHGAGSGGTRNISGNSTSHEELEKELASLHQKKAALLFSSGYVANHSTLCTLAKHLPNCHVFSDENNHPSMILGIKDSGVPKLIFKHNNPEDLERKLQTVDPSVPKIVAFETVHSTTGAVCPLEKLCDIAHKYGAITFVSEEHAVGLYGENGAGIGERDGVLHKIDIISGTLEKAFGNFGGYIASLETIVDMVRSYAAGFIFTTSLPITVLQGSLKALRILKSDEGRRLRAKLQENVEYPFNQYGGSPAGETKKNIPVSKCPFMEQVKPTVKAVNSELDDENIDLGKNEKLTDHFKYEDFFLEKIAKKKADHSYRIFKKVNRLANNFPCANEYSDSEKKVVVWCSNDYLGMSSHSKVKQAVIDAVEIHGTGNGGIRNISGNSTSLEELEKELASLHKKQAALLFTSCYVANHSTLCTIAKHLPNCHIFSDEGNHASMIHGIKDSGVPKIIFKHNDPEDLERKLQTVDPSVPKIVAFETVHSMTGAVCPLEKLCDIAHKYRAITFVDEVHAVGLYGWNGAGIGERDGVLHKMDIISGTLGKAFGNFGGYITSSETIVNMVQSYAAGLIFTPSLPFTVLRGSLAAIRILKSDEGRMLRAKHQENVKYLRRSLQGAGIPVVHCPSHIIPVHVGNPYFSTKVSNDLIERHGHYVQAINHPTVPIGEEKLRIAPTPFHTVALMDKFVADLVDTWKHAGLELRHNFCNQECVYCKKPLYFEALESRVYPCGGVGECPQIAVQ